MLRWGHDGQSAALKGLSVPAVHVWQCLRQIGLIYGLIAAPCAAQQLLATTGSARQWVSCLWCTPLLISSWVAPRD